MDKQPMLHAMCCGGREESPYLTLPVGSVKGFMNLKVSSSSPNDGMGQEGKFRETHKEVWQHITHSETCGVTINMWALQLDSLCLNSGSFNSEHIAQLSVSPFTHLLNTVIHNPILYCRLPQWLSGKDFTCNAGAIGDAGSIPGSGRFPGGGQGNPHLYSCLENPKDRGAWQATVHGVAKSWTYGWSNLACRHTFCIAKMFVKRTLTHRFVMRLNKLFRTVPGTW